MFWKRTKRLTGGLALIVPLCTLAYLAAFVLRFDGQLDPPTALLFFTTLPWILAVKVLAIVHARLHLEYNRYVTFHDMVLLGRTVTISTVGIMLVDAMVLPHLTIPRSIVLLDWGTTLALLAVVRIAPRLLRDHQWRMFTMPRGTSVLIVGANDAGESLLRSIRSNPRLHYLPIGFIDPRPDVVGRRIAGVPVLGTNDDIAALADEHHIEEVLLTAGSLSGREVRALTELAAKHHLRVKVLPSSEQLLNEHVAIQARPVAITDLLRRPTVDLDIENIRQWLAGKVVLVTGSAGSIGSELCRQLLELEPAKLVLVDRTETGQFFLERVLKKLAPQAEIEVVLADLTDCERLQWVMRQQRPQVIFHAAAYKHVPLMESHVGEAVKNIVLATRNLADLAEEHDVESLVMISTDKAVNPTSVMGSCKRLAEQYVQAKAATSDCRFVTVRFGNVLDSAGSVVPIFREQISQGGPVTITHPEMVRYFMLIPEAAQLVIQAGAMGQGGEIFVLDMGEPVRIVDLARDMIRLSGLRVGDDIEIAVTGLRPGEKLFEELYSDAEQHRATSHDKIMVSVGEPRPLLQVLSDINTLDSSVNGPDEVTRDLLRQIIPLHGDVPSTTTAERRQAA